MPQTFPTNTGGPTEINPTATPSVAKPTLDRIASAIVIIIMVLVCVVLAGFNVDLGKILAVFLSGVFLIWLIGPGEGYVQKWLAPLGGAK